MEGKAYLAKLFQDYAVVADSLVICAFMQNNGLTLPQTVEVLNAVTGAVYDPVSLMKVGERATNLQRVFNNRAGFARADDRLPARMFEPAKNGPRKDRIPPDFDEALNEYYRLRGWTQDGVPSEETLEKLELEP
jgi:aldehyde:ferredoxin oxidoreductase